jgi:hypothetical protein
MIDLVFPVYNRLEFTMVAARALAAHTNPALVGKVHVYDDNSVDGAGRAAFEILAATFPSTIVIRRETGFGGPVEVMNEYLNFSRCELFAKIDNDTVVCPRWLDICFQVMQRNPRLDLLGIEPHHQIEGPEYESERGYDIATHIGGIGLMRTECFKRSRRMLYQSQVYYGFTHWQVLEEEVRKGWLTPALPITLLDRIPVDPWKSLSEKYLANKWQREFSVYDPASHVLWDGLTL